MAIKPKTPASTKRSSSRLSDASMKLDAKVLAEPVEAPADAAALENIVSRDENGVVEKNER